MVKLKIIVRDGNLVLRISEGKQRFYKSVRHLLKGAPNIEKHWNADKERFTSYAVSYSENNKILEDFKANYSKLVLDHPEYTARQVASAFTTSQRLIQGNGSAGASKDSFIFLEKYSSVRFLKPLCKGIRGFFLLSDFANPIFCLFLQINYVQ